MQLHLRTIKRKQGLYTLLIQKNPQYWMPIPEQFLYGDGTPYKEDKVLEYTDISDHYAKKQIEMMAEMGIGLEGPELKPDEKIKQKDFLLLISQVLGEYPFYGKLR